MRSPFRFLGTLMAVLILLGPSVPGRAADGGEPYHLTVEYLEFPPYYYTNSAMQPDGFLLKLADAAFAEAGVHPDYESQSAKLILSHMHSDLPVCSIGWFKTPERETFARFSRKIYQNRPVEVVFLEKNASLFEKHETLASLVRDRSLTLGKAKNYSQGKVADEIIAEGAPRTTLVNGSYADLFRLLAAGEFSYFIVASEYIDYQIRRNHLNVDLFVHKKMADIPEGNIRYLMYSQGVPESVIRRIDKALEKVIKSQKK